MLSAAAGHASTLLSWLSNCRLCTVNPKTWLSTAIQHFHRLPPVGTAIQHCCCQQSCKLPDIYLHSFQIPFNFTRVLSTFEYFGSSRQICVRRTGKMPWGLPPLCHSCGWEDARQVFELHMRSEQVCHELVPSEPVWQACVVTSGWRGAGGRTGMHTQNHTAVLSWTGVQRVAAGQPCSVPAHCPAHHTCGSRCTTW